MNLSFETETSKLKQNKCLYDGQVNSKRLMQESAAPVFQLSTHV